MTPKTPMMPSRVCEPFTYNAPYHQDRPHPTPKGYECSRCGRGGLRLFREYGHGGKDLLCAPCVFVAERRSADCPVWPAPAAGSDWVLNLCAAVPTEDGFTFWGFSSVPEDGVRWWNRLAVFHWEQLK